MNNQIDVNVLENEFKNTPLFLSYSSLSKLHYSPKLYYKHYVLKEKEEDEERYTEGKLIHSLLLDNGSFDEKFLLSPGTLPGDNNKLIIDNIYKIHLEVNDGRALLSDYSNEILALLLSMNLHQSLVDDKKPVNGVSRTGDQKRLEKILTIQNEEYFEHLKVKKDRQIIDAETLDKCAKIVDILKTEPRTKDLLKLDNYDDNIQVFNEKEIKISQEELPFGFKGFLDNYTVDYSKKMVIVNDLKTTSKSIVYFVETIEIYNYWIQAAIYKKLIQHELKDVLTKEWTISFNFIVVDKFEQVYSFSVSDETMTLWEERLDDIIKKASWHIENMYFKLPYDYAHDLVIL
jgi:hypothetical protein